MSLVIGVLVGALCLAHVAINANRRGWEATTLFLLSYLVLIHLGFMRMSLEDFGTAGGDTAVRVSSVGLTAFVLGCYLFDGRRGTPRRLVSESAEGVRLPPLSTDQYRAGLSIGWVLCCISLCYFVLLGSFPLVDGVRSLMAGNDEASVVNSIRVNRDVYINPDARYIPMQGLFELFRYVGMPMCALWAALSLRDHKVRHQGACLLIVTLCLVVASGQRWPLLYCVFALVVSATSRRRITRRTRLRFASAGVVSVIVLSTLLGRRQEAGSSSLGEMVGTGASDLLDRILVEQALVPFLSYERWNFGTLNGASYVQSLRAYFPGPGQSFSVDFYTGVTGDSTGFTAPPDFFTEAYLNFGLAGVLVFGLGWSLLLCYWDNRGTNESLGVSRVPRDVVTIFLGFSSFTGPAFLFGVFIVFAFVLASSRILLSGVYNRNSNGVWQGGGLETGLGGGLEFTGGGRLGGP